MSAFGAGDLGFKSQRARFFASCFFCNLGLYGCAVCFYVAVGCGWFVVWLVLLLLGVLFDEIFY